MSRKISLGIYNSSGGRVFSIIRCLPFLISIFFSSEIIGLFRLDDIANVENESTQSRKATDLDISWRVDISLDRSSSKLR